MNHSTTYKHCVVPLCLNTSINSPTKIFIHAPLNPEKRKLWLRLAGNDKNFSNKTKVYFCEDHFELSKDMANYQEYKMGFTRKIRMIDECLPSKFECQFDPRGNLSTANIFEASSAKKPKFEVIKECETFLKAGEQISVQSENASVQVSMKPKIRSKAIQVNIEMTDARTSPWKPETNSISTSPLKNVSDSMVAKKLTFTEEEEEEKDDSDISIFAPSVKSQESTDSDDDNNKELSLHLQSLQYTLKLIQAKPLFYIGISEKFYFLIDLIHKHTCIPQEHILMCLKKIRLDTKFSELQDNFGITLSYASKVFFKNVPIIANILRPFIIKLDKVQTKKCLPIAFRYKYYKVSCIIDCLEIEIQKPSKAINQSLTWSEYKKTNTIKYLISCTPNGLINYISPGYGGRITDVALTENCDFLDTLESDACILADRGFKHLDSILLKKGMTLVRPPSVTTGSKMTKEEARETKKKIASLRIHVERVIRRVREFSLLKPHSVVNVNIIRILDDIIVIACALINLQNPLIK